MTEAVRLRLTGVPVIDLIDMGLVLLQSKCDFDAMDFFLDLFPDDMTDRDFEDYFGAYDLVKESQRPAMERLAEILKQLLMEKGKWGNGWAKYR